MNVLEKVLHLFELEGTSVFREYMLNTVYRSQMLNFALQNNIY